MGLDVYVGPLTRYHAGTWETVTARYAREQGIEYRVLRTPTDPEDAVIDPREIAQGVQLWRAGLSAALQPHLSAKLDWSESPDESYFTDKPDWQGYIALTLLAAHAAVPGFSQPRTVPSSCDDDPAYARLAGENFRCRFSQLFEVALWLPSYFDFRFKAQDVAGNEVLMGSSPMLREQLLALNADTFRASDAELTALRAQGVDPNAPFEPSARFGLAVFLNLAQVSAKQRLPMRLDY